MANRERKFAIHNVGPMTLRELSAHSCGHCRHKLTMHATSEAGNTRCALCFCLRTKGEDILQPHNFREGS